MKGAAPEGCFRYFAEIAYDGSAYHGWQVQPNAHTVQAEINLHWSRYFAEEINVVGCGRTDTGVHASHFFLHFDLHTEIADVAKAVYKLSRMLPDDIAIRSIQRVSNEAHARFSATSRTYHYHLHNRKDPFASFSSWVPFELDLDRMNAAAQTLLGTRDFGAFCKTGSDVNNTMCTITGVSWIQVEGRWTFEISANRFLRNMVRAVVGTLVDVGRGYTSLDEFAKILESGDRGKAGASMTPTGLFLTHVGYPFLD